MSMQSSSIIIRGLGSYIPKKQLSNDDLAKIVDTSDEWIQTRTGIKTRHIASMEENPSDMGTQAAETAIKNAGLNKKDIDLLVVATMTPDLPFPSTACITQAKLGLRTIPAFDISAACSGFLYVLDTVYHLLRSGPYKNALVIGAEKMSSTLDWQDRTTCVLFGDAAGAAVLSKVDTPNVGILGSTLGADGTDPSILHMPAGGAACPASAESIEKRQHYLRMNGREVFRLAVRAMEQATRTILDQFDLKPEDIACIIPHQANVRIMQSLGKYLQVPEEKIFINLNKYGNTSAASIPVAITEAHKQGRIHPGDYVILVAFGAGLTWGATLIKWHS